MPDPEDVPNLDRIFGAFVAYQLTGAMTGAVELDLFTALGAGRSSSDELAAKIGGSPRGTRILCDTLTASGYLIKEDGLYRSSASSAAFLDRNSPMFVGDAVRFIASPTVREGFGKIAEAVRRGGTAVDGAGVLAPDHPVWVDFARWMAPLSQLLAHLIAGLLEADAGQPWKVLDVAAGHGKFGIALAQRNPRARIVAQDWPNVLEVAADFARSGGVADRWETLPGDAFAVDFGSGYDLVLLTNILHHFDRATCIELLKKVHAALKPGGRAVTLDFIPDADRVTPAPAATFAMVMLAITAAGDVYTFAELEEMCAAAGFAKSELHPLPPSFERVVISTR